MHVGSNFDNERELGTHEEEAAGREIGCLDFAQEVEAEAEAVLVVLREALLIFSFSIENSDGTARQSTTI